MGDEWALNINFVFMKCVRTHIEIYYFGDNILYLKYFDTEIFIFAAFCCLKVAEI